MARRERRVVDDPPLAPAAVLVLIYPKDGEPYVLFTKRTEKVEHHKGEVSFPGGARDSGDAGLLDTALRETEEELGIAPDDVTILEELDDTPTGTGFVIRPFVGVIEREYSILPNPAEIDRVIDVPLRALMCPENHRVETRWIGGLPSESYSFAHDGRVFL